MKRVNNTQVSKSVEQFISRDTFTKNEDWNKYLATLDEENESPIIVPPVEDKERHDKFRELLADSFHLQRNAKCFIGQPAFMSHPRG